MTAARLGKILMSVRRRTSLFKRSCGLLDQIGTVAELRLSHNNRADLPVAVDVLFGGVAHDGQRAAEPKLYYSFSLDRAVPANHLVRRLACPLTEM